MTTLDKYLLHRNTSLILMCLGMGVVLYLLSDVFDRLDDFLDAGLGPGAILSYFLAKTPLILSQIMPASFLIAVVVQLSLLQSSREMLALSSGGVPYLRIVAVFLALGVAWSGVQIGFSQWLGVAGERASSRIWQEQVRDKKIDRMAVHDVWFRDGSYIVESKEAWPARREGRAATIYEMSEDRQSILRIISADRFTVMQDGWDLFGVTIRDPATFETTRHDTFRVPLRQDLSAFSAIAPKADPAQLPLWELGRVISSLTEAGSNVESLRTTWHAKLAYGFSILCMALVALGVTSFRRNIYVNVGMSLCVTFVFYGVYVMGTTAGQKGILPPLAGAWLGNILFGLAGASRILWVSSR